MSRWGRIDQNCVLRYSGLRIIANALDLDSDGHSGVQGPVYDKVGTLLQYLELSWTGITKTTLGFATGHAVIAAEKAVLFLTFQWDLNLGTEWRKACAITSGFPSTFSVAPPLDLQQSLGSEVHLWLFSVLWAASTPSLFVWSKTPCCLLTDIGQRQQKKNGD